MPSRSGTEHREGPRAVVALPIQLGRRAGPPVSALTVDLGAGGVRVTSKRPLRVDEELSIDVELRPGRPHLDGIARVLRQDRHDVYALRFERLPPECVAELRSFLDATARTQLL